MKACVSRVFVSPNAFVSSSPCAVVLSVCLSKARPRHQSFCLFVDHYAHAVFQHVVGMPSSFRPRFTHCVANKRLRQHFKNLNKLEHLRNAFCCRGCACSRLHNLTKLILSPGHVCCRETSTWSRLRRPRQVVIGRETAMLLFATSAHIHT